MPKSKRQKRNDDEDNQSPTHDDEVSQESNLDTDIQEPETKDSNKEAIDSRFDLSKLDTPSADNEDEVTKDSEIGLGDHPLDQNLTKEKVIEGQKDKRGVIYMEYIPQGLNPQLVRKFLSEYGEVGRIFLVPKRDSKGRIGFEEGWVEFKKKRIAKMVAGTLHGNPIGGKRKYIFRDSLWSMKYLKRFKWHHLIEQLAYEEKLKQHRLRLQMSAAKKESEYYENLVEQRNKMKKKNTLDQNREATYRQRSTVEEALHKQGKPAPDKELDLDLLKKIFA